MRGIFTCIVAVATALFALCFAVQAEPTAPISDLTNIAVGANSVSLSWVNPSDATGVFVEGRGGTSENNFFEPTHNECFNNNADWNSAPVPTDGYGCKTLLYGGVSQSNLTVTGLSADTDYTFLAYPFDGTVWGCGDEDYYTVGPVFLHVRTLSAEPTLAASSVSFTNVTGTMMTLNWVRGNGDGVIIIVRAGAQPVTPSDGTTYSANAAFGSGDDVGSSSYVVYKGNGTVAAINGLTVNTTYYVTVIEYSGSSGGENYLLTGRPVESRTTPSVAPGSSASGVSFSSIGATELTVGWNNGNGSRRLALIRSGSAVAATPANGLTYTANATYGEGADFGNDTFAIFDGINGPVTVSGLAAGTTYHVAVYEYNGTGESTAYRTAAPGTGSQSTVSAEPATQASEILFTGVATDQLTVSWANGDGANRMVVLRAGNPVSGDPTDGVTYTNNQAFGGGTVVYNGSGTNVTATGLSAGVLYYARAYEYNGSSGSENYLADTATDNPNSQRTLLGAPTLNSASDESSSSFVASWSSVANATGYRLDVSTQADCAGSYVGSYNNYDVGNNNQQVVSGLNAGTLYYFRVKAYSGTSTSSYSSIENTTTISAAPNALSATAMTALSFSANWLASTGATNYFIDVATDESFSSMVGGFDNLLVGNALTQPITGLSPAQNYYYRVRSQSSGGTSANSSTITALTVPASPEIREGQYISTNSFQALWFQATGATGYRLDASTDPNFATFISGYENLNVGLVTTYTVQNTDLSTGVTNYYRTRAYNGSGTSTNSASASVEKPSAVVLYYFELLRNGGDVQVAWATASEARTTGFQLYRLTEQDTWIKLGNFVTAEGQSGMGAQYSVPDPDATQGQAYTYKLVEYEDTGKQNEYGPFVRSTTEFAFNPLRITEEGLELTWLSWKDETYDIYRSLDLEEGDYVLVAGEVPATPPQNVFLDSEIDGLSAAFYRIELHEEPE